MKQRQRKRRELGAGAREEVAAPAPQQRRKRPPADENPRGRGVRQREAGIVELPRTGDKAHERGGEERVRGAHRTLPEPCEDQEA